VHAVAQLAHGADANTVVAATRWAPDRRQPRCHYRHVFWESPTRGDGAVTT
jgi:hypothetical protein